MSELTKEEVMQLISIQLEKAEAALGEAARLAKKHDVNYVHWDSVHGGMAGYLNDGKWEPANDNWDSSSAYC